MIRYNRKERKESNKWDEPNRTETLTLDPQIGWIREEKKGKPKKEEEKEGPSAHEAEP